MAHIGTTKNKLYKVWENILDYIFPRECFGCAKEGEYFCSACFDKIDYLQDDKCYICHDVETQKGICSECSLLTGIDEIIIATHYNKTAIGQLVEGLKYNYIEEAGKILAQVLDQKIKLLQKENYLYNQILLPVPLHRKRLVERGFNQSQIIAKHLAVKYNAQIEDKLIRRVKNTVQQAKLNREERLKNLKYGFQVDLKAVLPKKVVVLDDVLTTGSTFSEISQQLKKAGVEYVICLAVCHG